jgi:flavorubredoxin
VYRLGAAEPRDERLSWAPPLPGCYEPINAYLLIEGGRALLVDSGVAAHEHAVVEQLARVLPERCSLSLFLTRAEMDCMGNVAAIARRFELVEVLTGGVVNPFDAFDHVTSLVPQAVRFTRGADRAAVEVAPGRRLVVLRPTLRLLATFWAYDEATRTLFTSDAFGHVPANRAGAPPVSADAALASADAAAAGFGAKFEWLMYTRGAAAVAADIAALFRELPVDAIAPTHGCVLLGTECVSAHVHAVVEALERIAGGGRG